METGEAGDLPDHITDPGLHPQALGRLEGGLKRGFGDTSWEAVA